MHFEYSTVPGFFKHDEDPEGPGYRATTTPGLGLLDREYKTDGDFDPEHEKTQWERFARQLAHLNAEGHGKTRYKLIFVIRHGEGFHNAKEAEVGRAEWEAKWALVDGDDKMTWADAKLTDKGREQAGAICASLQRDSRELKMPVPARHYTSPLARCLETTRLAFSGFAPHTAPVVKELLRERLGRHTCDRRSSRSWIAANYPEFDIEPGFTEQDELWNAEVRETNEELVVRIRKLLDDVFSNGDEVLVSFTAHSGAIRALYSATRHREVWVGPGTLVPLLVRADLEESGSDVV